MITHDLHYIDRLVKHIMFTVNIYVCFRKSLENKAKLYEKISSGNEVPGQNLLALTLAMLNKLRCQTHF